VAKSESEDRPVLVISDYIKYFQLQIISSFDCAGIAPLWRNGMKNKEEGFIRFSNQVVKITWHAGISP
jgi:hypothetical protein